MHLRGLCCLYVVTKIACKVAAKRTKLTNVKYWSSIDADT